PVYASQSATGWEGSIQSQQSDPNKKSRPVRYNGALQFEKCRTTWATGSGLRIEPICPEVFIAALSAPARLLPISIQVPQAAPSRKFEDAPPNEINTAASTGFSMNVPAIVKTPAVARAIPPTPARPIRRPKRFVSESVVSPPKMSATALKISGSPAS